MRGSTHFAKIRRILARHATNLRGFNTEKKIIVIESDDWGSIRMPSSEVYSKIQRWDPKISDNPYCRYDSLATIDDLTALFDILTAHRDSQGKHPVFTSNTVVANPNFECIENDDFRKYHYEPFTYTLEKYPKHDGAFALWKQGMAAEVFFPQFHGREHLNVEFWLKELQKPSPFARRAFEYGCWVLNYKINEKINIQASFDTDRIESLESHKQIITDGLDLFEQIFNYRSESFIANNFIFHESLLPVLQKQGVSVIQGMKYHPQPILSNKKRKMIRQYVGTVNDFQQVHLVRNCVFEPSQNKENFNSVESCLKDIENAFSWNKPAIITTHRLNYIGWLDENNRTSNLNKLHRLLKTILSKWPSVEFLTSSELGKLINTKGR